MIGNDQYTPSADKGIFRMYDILSWHLNFRKPQDYRLEAATLA